MLKVKRLKEEEERRLEAEEEAKEEVERERREAERAAAAKAAREARAAEAVASNGTNGANGHTSSVSLSAAPRPSAPRPLSMRLGADNGPILSMTVRRVPPGSSTTSTGTAAENGSSKPVVARAPVPLSARAPASTVQRGGRPAPATSTVSLSSRAHAAGMAAVTASLALSKPAPRAASAPRVRVPSSSAPSVPLGAAPSKAHANGNGHAAPAPPPPPAASTTATNNNNNSLVSSRTARDGAPRERNPNTVLRGGRPPPKPRDGFLRSVPLGGGGGGGGGGGNGRRPIASAPLRSVPLGAGGGGGGKLPKDLPGAKALIPTNTEAAAVVDGSPPEARPKSASLCALSTKSRLGSWMHSEAGRA